MGLLNFFTSKGNETKELSSKQKKSQLDQINGKNSKAVVDAMDTTNSNIFSKHNFERYRSDYLPKMRKIYQSDPDLKSSPYIKEILNIAGKKNLNVYPNVSGEEVFEDINEQAEALMIETHKIRDAADNQIQKLSQTGGKSAQFEISKLQKIRKFVVKITQTFIGLPRGLVFEF